VKVLTTYDIPYEKIKSNQIATTDLSRFSKIIIPSDQKDITYTNLSTAIPLLENYVANGGMLEVHAFDHGWNGGTWTNLLPGRVTHVINDTNDNYIVKNNSPIVSGLTNADFSGWNCVSVGYFTNLSANTSIIMKDSGNFPTVIEYRYGYGTVIATLQAVEWTHRNKLCQNGTILKNMDPGNRRWAVP
jgi:hypothetical protein